MLKSLKNKFNSLSQDKQDRIRTVVNAALFTTTAISSAALLKVGIITGLTKAAALTSAFLFANAAVFKDEFERKIERRNTKLAKATAIITFLALSPLANYGVTKYTDEFKKGLEYVDEAFLKDSQKNKKLTEDKKEKELVQKAPFKINI